MNDEHRQRLVDEYEEAAMKLLMDEYAEAEGKRLWQEFVQAEENGNVSDISEELDNKCKQLIQDSFAKRNRRAQLRRALRAFNKVAIITLILLGISTTLVLSVDALRIPVLNFFLRSNDRYTAITLNEENQSLQNELEDIQNSIGYLIPNEYALVFEDISDHGSMQLLYQNELGKIISLAVTPASGQLVIDTEDASVKETTVNEQQALFVDKDGFHIVWMNSDNKLTYDLFAEAIESTLFWELVYALAS